MATNSSQVTELIQAAIDGDRDVESKLCQLLMDQLRIRAHAILPESRGTLQATELVSLTWAKLFRRDNAPEFPNRNAFFAYAASAMRTLLIDHLRKRHRSVDGVGLEREPIEQLDAIVAQLQSQDQVDLLDLQEALEELRQDNERQFRTVECRYFGGMTMQEIADYHQVSLTTAENDWRLARAKLSRRLHSDSD